MIDAPAPGSSAPSAPAVAATRTADPRAIEALQQLLGLPYSRRLAVVGSSKNAGKTTTLNALLAACTARGEVAGLVSMGRDGEAVDAWLDFPKPQVRVEKGTLLVTAAAVVQRAGRLLETVLTLESTSALGATALARARAPGGVELCGVPHRSAVVEAVRALQACGAVRVLVDGAYHRQAAVHPQVADAVVVAVGALLGESPTQAAQAAWPTLWALSRPHWDGVAPALPWPGGLTDARVPQVLEQASAVVRTAGSAALLVAADPSRLLLSERGIAQLQARGIQVAVRDAVPLLAVTTNPLRPGAKNADPAQWLDAVVQLLKDRGLAGVPVLDVVTGAMHCCAR